MDKQMKRGFTEACVLAVLARGESYGYQIVRDAPPALELTESTLYPVLKRLEQAGCVTTRTAEHNGRLRRYYCVEAPGVERLQAFLGERADVMSVYDFVERAVRDVSEAQRGRPAAPAGTVIASKSLPPTV